MTRRRFSRYLLLLNLLTPMAVRAQTPWLVSNRFQLGSEYDDNIYESSRRATAAFAGRALFRSRVEREWKRAALAASYSGGLQSYPGYADENKLTNELGGDLRWRATTWLSFVGTAQGLVKVYFNAPLDFATTLSALRANLQLPHRWLVALSATSSRLDYAESDNYDYSYRSAGLGLSRLAGHSWRLDAELSFASLHFLRPVYSDNANMPLFILANHQRDQQMNVHLRLTFSRKHLIQLLAEYQRNASNSRAHEYDRFRLSGIAGFRLSPRWLLRLAFLGQYKKYAADILPVTLIELDLERSESNSVVVDLSFDVSREINWLLRSAFYDNEAAFRNRFYQKKLLFTGLEYRF